MCAVGCVCAHAHMCMYVYTYIFIILYILTLEICMAKTKQNKKLGKKKGESVPRFCSRFKDPRSLKIQDRY